MSVGNSGGQFQWEVSGFVLIDRAEGHGEGFIQIPFVMIEPGDGPPPTPEEIDAYATEIGENFLDILAQSDPTHRLDYGEVADIQVTLITPVSR